MGIGTEDYDATHAAMHGSALMGRLWSQAMGDEYPVQVEPSGTCSWWLLGQFVAALPLRPGGLLVDLGCGRGGTGLWLARATATRLIGIDFSAVAVELAAQRTTEFVEPDCAQFRQSRFEATDLPDAEAEGAVSVDAVPFAPDRTAALVEARRILAPGARLAFTCRLSTKENQDWQGMAPSAGLDVEDTMAVPGNEDFGRRLHGPWLAHEAELRAELSQQAVDTVVRKATQARQRTEDVPAVRHPRAPPPHRLSQVSGAGTAAASRPGTGSGWRRRPR